MSVFIPKPIDVEFKDAAINSDDLPWLPLGPGSYYKPLHFWPATGQFANLIKVEGRQQVQRHVHAGGQVFGYVIQGSWRYLEHDWVATAGSWVWEPPGDVHTLEVIGDETMITLFVVSGVVQYLDDDDNVVVQNDFRSRRHAYLEHCKELGVEPLALVS